MTSAIIKNSKFYLGGGDDTVSLTMTRTDIDNNTQIFVVRAMILSYLIIISTSQKSLALKN